VESGSSTIPRITATINGIRMPLTALSAAAATTARMMMPSTDQLVRPMEITVDREFEPPSRARSP
jgi:hypothetical protein